MATTGVSTAALRGLRDRIAGLGGPPFQAKLAQLCGAAALKLVADEFRGSHAPDGTPWAPLMSRFSKLRRRQYGPRARGKPLMDTGRLRASFAVEPSSEGFRIGTAVAYAGYHQSGTKRIPARPMLPSGRLPPSWVDAFQREIAGAVAREMRAA